MLTDTNNCGVLKYAAEQALNKYGSYSNIQSGTVVESGFPHLFDSHYAWDSIRMTDTSKSTNGANMPDWLETTCDKLTFRAILASHITCPTVAFDLTSSNCTS